MSVLGTRWWHVVSAQTSSAWRAVCSTGVQRWLDHSHCPSSHRYPVQTFKLPEACFLARVVSSSDVPLWGADQQVVTAGVDGDGHRGGEGAGYTSWLLDGVRTAIVASPSRCVLRSPGSWPLCPPASSC
jgi:hypothetical protein